MKIILVISSLLISGIIIYLYSLAYISKSYSAPGLVNEQLSKCSANPNCACSEFEEDEPHYIEPIQLSLTDDSKILENIKTTLQKMNGTVITEDDSYISATFTSNIFGFIDDFEIRIDRRQKLIHIRSASRVGRSDFGANIKRINLIKKELRAQLQ